MAAQFSIYMVCIFKSCFVCSDSHVIIVRNDDALFHIGCASLKFINVNGTKKKKKRKKQQLVAKQKFSIEELERCLYSAPVNVFTAIHGTYDVCACVCV